MSRILCPYCGKKMQMESGKCTASDEFFAYYACRTPLEVCGICAPAGFAKTRRDAEMIALDKARQAGRWRR